MGEYGGILVDAEVNLAKSVTPMSHEWHQRIVPTAVERTEGSSALNSPFGYLQPESCRLTLCLSLDRKLQADFVLVVGQHM